MQRCGLCSLISSLLRRAMCVGSRRGSGDSYYQELAETTAPDVATMETTDSSIYIRLIPNSSNTNISNSNNNNSNSNTISNMNAATTAAATTTVVATTTGQGPRRMSDSDKDRTIFDEFLADENSANPRRRNLCNGRFLTMHKRRRKKLQTRSLTYDQAILDDVLHGQVQCILDQVGNWRFNAFTLETVTGGRSLPVLCVHLFHWYGLLDHFNLDVVRVWKLFSLIEEGYHSINPYHNSIHATDVTQAMHCFLQESKILEHLEPLEIMASLIGAVTHDLDHPGVNQPFLIATSNHLAALYENTSVLENHHWRSAVGCLLESGVAEQINDIRPELEKQISSLILATDITRQQEFINKFKDYLNNDSLDMHNSDHRHFILQIALKCADISNPCRPWDISKKWSHKVCEEFFRQGDFERQLNLPITSLCDRQSTSVPKIQSGFFKFVVTPLMNEWHRFLHTDLSNKMMRHLKFNQNQWESRLEAEIAEETRTEISDAELLDEPDDCFDHRQIEYVVDVDIDIDPDLLDDPADTSGSSEILIPNMRRRSLQVPGYGSFKNNRRHSMPVHSIPKIILQPSENIIQPIRPQESILESDEHRFDNDSLSILSSDSDSPSPRARSLADSAERERPLSAENLLPDLSITSMTNSACAERINYVMHGASSCSNTSNLLSVGTSKHLIRQQTFPPLQAYARTRYLSSTAELGACPEALLESNSSSSNESGADTDNRRVLLNKKDSFKRDPTDLYLCDNKSSKFAKLSVVIGTGQKENLDPSILRRSLSRRRGSAPVTVAIPPKSVGSGAAGDGSDVAVSYMLKTEYISLNTRDSITQHIQVVTSGNNNNSNNHNNNSSSNSNNNNNQRRGSVPCDNSSNSVLFRTNNLNSKRRNNTKKNYHRRFSGGAEILGPMRSEILEQQQQQSSNNNCSSSSTSGGPGGNGAGNGTGSGTSSSAWYRFKREISRRTDVETLLTKRRGSLPVEVLTVNYSGTLRH